MISEQIVTTLVVSLVLIVAFAAAIFFIPALIELKRPRDAGPRVIAARLNCNEDSVGF